MAKRRYISEAQMNRDLEMIAQRILESAHTVEEAAQIVRQAKGNGLDIEVDIDGVQDNQLNEVVADVPGGSPEGMIAAMQMLHTKPTEYVICMCDGNNRKVLSRHTDKEEARKAGKAAAERLTNRTKSIIMVSGNISDDGAFSGPISFYESW